MSTITRTQTIRSLTCGSCGVLFGLESSFMAARQDDGAWFYCPNGHRIGWHAVNAAERAEKQLQAELAAARSLAQREAQRRATAEENARNSERRRAAAKGQLTKTKNRIAAGVCPCCNRTFQNVARHIAGQHPDFAGGDQ